MKSFTSSLSWWLFRCVVPAATATHVRRSPSILLRQMQHTTQKRRTQKMGKRKTDYLSLSLFPLIELRQAQHSSCLLGGPSKPEQSQYNNMLVARGFNGCGRQRPCRDVLYHNGSIQSQTRARDMSSCITTTHALLLFCMSHRRSETAKPFRKEGGHAKTYKTTHRSQWQF